MLEIDIGQRNRYFAEISLQLRRAGFTVGVQHEQQLPVLWEGAHLCRITGDGSARYHDEDLTGERREVFFRVLDIRDRVSEYMRHMETGPRIEATGLHDDYRLLAEYNGIVLAGHKFTDAPGHAFVTWERSYDRTSVAHGNYTDNYEAAKQDFATRSGLVQQGRLFTDEQLAEIYDCVNEALDNAETISPSRETLLKNIAEQIEGTVPELDRFESQSEVREMEYRQKVSQVPEMG